MEGVGGQRFLMAAHDEEDTEEGSVPYTERHAGHASVIDPGIALLTLQGMWNRCPAEYRKGLPRENVADDIQLCAQTICLKEMPAREIPYGILPYGEKRIKSL